MIRWSMTRQVPWWPIFACIFWILSHVFREFDTMVGQPLMGVALVCLYMSGRAEGRAVERERLAGNEPDRKDVKA